MVVKAEPFVFWHDDIHAECRSETFLLFHLRKICILILYRLKFDNTIYIFTDGIMIKREASPHISHEKIIDVLLFEYDTLRQDMLTAMIGVQTLGTVAVVSLITAMGLIYQTSSEALYLVLPPIIVIFASVYVNYQWVILFIARYLRVIEDRVNQIAGIPIALWETSAGSQFYESKIFLRNKRTKKKVFNYYPLTAGTILIILFFIFVFSLWDSTAFILKLYPTQTLLAYLWASVHIFIILFILLARFLALPSFLELIESEMRQLMYSFNDPLNIAIDVRKSDNQSVLEDDMLIEYYNKHAHKYDHRLATRIIGWRETKVLSLLIPSNSTRALDFGCGTGRSLLPLLRAGHIVSGYDPSQNMLSFAKTKIRCKGYKADWFSSREEFQGKRWPLITCIGVLDYFQNVTVLLSVLRELLEPEGMLIISCPNARSPLGLLFGFLSKRTCRVYPKSEQSLSLALVQSGFKILKVSYAFPDIKVIGHTVFIKAQLVG